MVKKLKIKFKIIEYFNFISYTNNDYQYQKCIMKNKDKIIILTGGSRGIGHATSKKFWDDGWTVITFSRSEVAPKCPWSNNTQLHFQVDLENQISLDKTLLDLHKVLEGRPVKALINNAAVSPKNSNNKRLGIYRY